MITALPRTYLTATDSPFKFILHTNDAGKRWTWIFINVIPLVGAICFLVILCQPSIPKA